MTVTVDKMPVNDIELSRQGCGSNANPGAGYNLDESGLPVVEKSLNIPY